MARWRALGDDLDPQVREFAALMRRRIERSGVSIATLADATGYSRSSWERYLNGRLLPPKYAVVALAEVTGTEPGHLTTMWELTERAWTRAEGRHDATIQSHLVAEARAALGEFGPAPDLGRPARAPSGRGRRALLFVAGVLAVVLAVVGGTLLLGDRGSTPQRAAGGSSSPSPSSSSPSLQAQGDLPSGVKCGGARCTGQDPEAMGCGGKYARTAAAAWVGGTYVEMRYSRTCGAVWARISAAASGDTVTVTDGAATQRTVIGQDTAAYTPMLAVSAPGRAKACATLATGARGCTPPGT